MAVPTFDKMLRPILALAVERDVTRRLAEETMGKHFEISQEERSARIPSGSSTYVANRSGWAMTFLTKAGLLAKVAPKTYRATDAGKKFLLAHRDGIRVKDLKAIEGWEEA